MSDPRITIPTPEVRLDGRRVVIEEYPDGAVLIGCDAGEYWSPPGRWGKKSSGVWSSYHSAFEYVKACAREEEQAITPEWLLSVGFKQIDGARENDVEIGNLQTFPEFINCEGNRRWVLCQGNSFTHIPHQIRPRTRDEVYQLAKRLGIKLATEPQR